MATDEYVPPSSDRRSGQNSDTIAHLRDYGPSTREALPGSPDSDGTREVVARLRLTGVSHTAKTRPRARSRASVCYLYGDERRAVRKYIEENTAFVASCFGDANSPIHEHSLYAIFKEEWEWGDWEADDA